MMPKPETTHTPGEWKWFDYPDGRKLLSGANRAVIHCPDAPMGVTVEDQHLIAAAPELYEALKELVEMLRAEAPGTTLNNHRFDALGIKANNALLKAEGRR